MIEENKLRSISIEEALEIAGVNSEAFDILNTPFVIQNMVDPKQVMAFYVAVSKANGMMFLFANAKEDQLVSL